MEYTGEGIEALVAALDDLQNAGLIMADKKIKAVLKCLAYYDEFRTVLAYCSDGFDYAAEKRKALQKAGDYHVLRLPKNAKTLVPLVAGLLVEFDDGTEDFISFCATYYPAADRQGSMTACCADMLERFKLDIVSLVVEGVKEDAPLAPRTVEFAQDGLQKQTEYLLVAMGRWVPFGRGPQGSAHHAGRLLRRPRHPRHPHDQGGVAGRQARPRLPQNVRERDRRHGRAVAPLPRLQMTSRRAPRPSRTRL